jgi:hypothetical protein
MRCLSHQAVVAAVVALLLAVNLTATAQTTPSARKLPSAERIVDNYLKAIGGKKTAAAIRDATYEYSIQVNDQPFGTARAQTKLPASERWEMTFGNGQVISATNSGSAWERGIDGQLRTLTGPEAATAKLHGILSASRLVNTKKSNVLARVITIADPASDPAYTIEFSTRGGARLQYYFSTKTGLLTKVIDDVRKNRTSFEDYRREKGILEPHKIRVSLGSGDLLLFLKSVSYDQDLAKSLFDPPAAAETVDVIGLLREVARNQDVLEKRVSEYAFRQKETDRQITDKGVIKKETVKVYEVYPIPNREPVLKLISENGVELSGERATREEKRVLEELEKAERDREKDEREAERKKAQQAKKNEAEQEDPEISQFLRACEFVSPRREKFNGREAIVFDFRPRPGFRPTNRSESLIAKLVGVVWIDPVDKQVMRLEARLSDGFKIGGGLVLSLRPGAALAMEQTRMIEGVWLPRYAQVNLSIKILLFGGGDLNKTIEWSDYRHFSGDVKDYKLDSPKSEAETKKPE